MRPFSSRMFPHTATYTRTTWTTSHLPGLKPTAAATGSLACNVVTAESETDPSFAGSQAIESQRIYFVSFPSDPTLARGDTLVWEGRTLVCHEPARPVARGQAWRMNCSHTA